MNNLIIFDCDGTLVDSEHLYNSITAKILNELGFAEYTPELCLDLFAGQSWPAIRKTLEERHQAPLPSNIITRFINTAEKHMAHDFRATPHAETTLKTLHNKHKICVASNGERSNIIKSLKVTNLLPFFQDHHIFSKSQVKTPKPAPDLFLFTCEKMQTNPNNAIIIEDSVPGVLAAKAAGIKVLGYIGASHAPEKQKHKLTNAGADHIINSLIHIQNHLINPTPFP